MHKYKQSIDYLSIISFNNFKPRIMVVPKNYYQFYYYCITILIPQLNEIK
jgi:hypothetical protein